MRIITDCNLDAEWVRACLNNSNCLRMTIIGDKKYFPDTWVSAPGYSLTKRHRFSCGGRFVQHRCIGNVERRQVDDHLLEIQQRFESSLRDFRLIRRISGVPPGILQDVSLNDGRCDAVVVASPDERARDFVLLCNHP